MTTRLDKVNAVDIESPEIEATSALPEIPPLQRTSFEESENTI